MITAAQMRAARALLGIDQRQLAAWSVEAVKLALHPFRSALGMKPLD